MKIGFFNFKNECFRWISMPKKSNLRTNCLKNGVEVRNRLKTRFFITYWKVKKKVEKYVNAFFC